MNAPAGQIAQSSGVDEIYTFLGPISPEEYEQRRRIRVCLNAAAYKLSQTKSQHARDLCGLVTETALHWRYRAAPVEVLEYAVGYMRNLLTVADQAEEMRVIA
jgi:hypothetical protein